MTDTVEPASHAYAYGYLSSLVADFLEGEVQLEELERDWREIEARVMAYESRDAR